MVERDKQYSACQLIINVHEAEPDRSGHLPAARGLQSPDCVLIAAQLRVLGPDSKTIFGLFSLTTVLLPLQNCCSLILYSRYSALGAY